MQKKAPHFCGAFLIVRLFALARALLLKENSEENCHRFSAGEELTL